MLPRPRTCLVALGLLAAAALAPGAPVQAAPPAEEPTPAPTTTPCAPVCDGTLRPVFDTFRDPEVRCSLLAPRNPVAASQDPAQRGVDLAVSIHLPPFQLTWQEADGCDCAERTRWVTRPLETVQLNLRQSDASQAWYHGEQSPHALYPSRWTQARAYGFQVYLHPPSDAAGDGWQLEGVNLTPYGGGETAVRPGLDWTYLVQAPHAPAAAPATLRTNGTGDTLTFTVRRLPLVMPGVWELDGQFSSRATPHSVHLHWQIPNELPPAARQFPVYLLEAALLQP